MIEKKLGERQTHICTQKNELALFRGAAVQSEIGEKGRSDELEKDRRHRRGDKQGQTRLNNYSQPTRNQLPESE